MHKLSLSIQVTKSSPLILSSSFLTPNCYLKNFRYATTALASTRFILYSGTAAPAAVYN